MTVRRLATGLWCVVCLQVVVAASDDERRSVNRLVGVEVAQDRQGLAVTLLGDGELIPADIRETPHWPPRLVVEFEGVSSWVHAETKVDLGPVEVIRVEAGRAGSGLTRVSFELRRPVDYDIVIPAGDRRRLKVVFPVGRIESSQVGSGTWALRVPASFHQAPSAGANQVGERSLARTRLISEEAGAAPQEPAASVAEYTGELVTLDFQEAPLRSVLRAFAEISGLNVVIDPQVQGVVDIALTAVPWDQALDVILRANRLGRDVDGTVVRIAPLSVLADEEEERRRLQEQRALSGEILVLTRTLSYARVEAMARLITESVLSSRGQVQTDDRTNTLIVSDLEPRLRAAEELLESLDRAEPQVEIEARIVQASRDFTRSIGVQWGMTGRAAPELGNTTPLTFPNRGV